MFQLREAAREVLNQLQKMHSKKILTSIHTFLTISGVYGSFPVSLLVVLLEVLMEYQFSCACSYERTVWLITLIFLGPFFFTFGLMFITFRPCKYSFCSSEEPKDRFKFWKDLGNCLIPPVIWIIVVFLDGDYWACGSASWKGNYVFDEEINRKWCKPERALALNTRLLQQMYQEFICDSQVNITYGKNFPCSLKKKNL